jgi:serine/threonine protein kinase
VHGSDVLPDARPYLVTELCEGSLADRIAARGRLDPHEVTAVGLVVGRALLHAHDAGVRHGDLTPEGVLLRDGAMPVLAGFELAVLRLPGRERAHAGACGAGDRARRRGRGRARTSTVSVRSCSPRSPHGAVRLAGRAGKDRLARILLDEPPSPGRRGSRPGGSPATRGATDVAPSPPPRRRRTQIPANRCLEKAPLTPT